ncbi:MAG: hypothetical protein AB7L90_09695 [Hyphomicrobiaceae bacterium]
MPIALATVAALHWLGLVTSAHATDGDVCSTCTLDARLAHLGDLIGDDPTRGRLEGRLENKPWIGQDWATLPVAVKPIDQNIDMSASLQHLGSYEARRNQQKLEEAKGLAPKGLPMPKPIATGVAPLDVWSKVEVIRLESVDGETRRGTVGADYKIARAALLGVSAAVRDETSTLASDTRLAAYFAVKPWSPVTFDAKAEWGESYAVTSPGLTTTQSALSARLKGDFRFEGLKLAPALTVAHGVDAADAVSGGALEKSTVALTPRISRPIDLTNGTKLEPFLTLKSALDFNASAAVEHDGTDTTHGIGGGMTLVKPNAYSLSVKTELERATGSETSNVSGRLELKVPLR